MTDDRDDRDYANETVVDALDARITALETAVTGLTEWAHNMLTGFEAVVKITEERLTALEEK
jgi:hypothetical protein